MIWLYRSKSEMDNDYEEKKNADVQKMAFFCAVPVHVGGFSAEHISVVVSLRIIVRHTAFSYLGSVRILWVLAENQQNLLWKINLSGVVANIVLNSLLIPIGGIAGAAGASLLTQFFTNFVVGFFVRPLRRNNDLIMQAISPSAVSDLIHKIMK